MFLFSRYFRGVEKVKGRYVPEVDGFVASTPQRTLRAAIAVCRTFEPHAQELAVTCAWSGRVLWLPERALVLCA